MRAHRRVGAHKAAAVEAAHGPDPVADRGGGAERERAAHAVALHAGAPAAAGALEAFRTAFAHDPLVTDKWITLVATLLMAALIAGLGSQFSVLGIAIGFGAGLGLKNLMSWWMVNRYLALMKTPAGLAGPQR